MSTEGGRSEPLHCPMCAGERLFPDEAAPTAWRCAECLRIFTVRILGVAPVPRGGTS